MQRRCKTPVPGALRLQDRRVAANVRALRWDLREANRACPAQHRLPRWEGRATLRDQRWAKASLRFDQWHPEYVATSANLTCPWSRRARGSRRGLSHQDAQVPPADVL